MSRSGDVQESLGDVLIKVHIRGPGEVEEQAIFEVRVDDSVSSRPAWYIQQVPG